MVLSLFSDTRHDPKATPYDTTDAPQLLLPRPNIRTTSAKLTPLQLKKTAAKRHAKENKSLNLRHRQAAATHHTAPHSRRHTLRRHRRRHNRTHLKHTIMNKNLIKTFAMTSTLVMTLNSCHNSTNGQATLTAPLDNVDWEASKWISAADAPVVTGRVEDGTRAADGAS